MHNRRLTEGMLWFFILFTALLIIMGAITGIVLSLETGSESRVEQINKVSHSCEAGTVPKVNFEGDGPEEGGHMTGFTCVIPK